jgi:hypothetical protein
MLNKLFVNENVGYTNGVRACEPSFLRLSFSSYLRFMDHAAGYLVTGCLVVANLIMTQNPSGRVQKPKPPPLKQLFHIPYTAFVIGAMVRSPSSTLLSLLTLFCPGDEFRNVYAAASLPFPSFLTPSPHLFVGFPNFFIRMLRLRPLIQTTLTLQRNLQSSTLKHLESRPISRFTPWLFSTQVRRLRPPFTPLILFS